MVSTSQPRGSPAGTGHKRGHPPCPPSGVTAGPRSPGSTPWRRAGWCGQGLRVIVTLCPAVVDSQKAQIVFLEKFEASPRQPQVAETSGGKGKSPRNLSPAGKAMLGRGSITSHQPPNPPQLLLAQLWGVCFAFPGDFTPHFPTVAPQEPGLSLTCAGEVPALDGVARARVHPARGFGVVAVKDKDRGDVSTPGGLRSPLPIAGEGSWHHRGLLQPKERILGTERNWDSGDPKKGETGGKERRLCRGKPAAGGTSCFHPKPSPPPLAAPQPRTPLPPPPAEPPPHPTRAPGRAVLDEEDSPVPADAVGPPARQVQPVDVIPHGGGTGGSGTEQPRAASGDKARLGKCPATSPGLFPRSKGSAQPFHPGCVRCE